ncbi:UNVERIFIED_CONTAM: hypothetical protein Sradi_3543800 [Sesamum radiatum]|uniref:DUF547 domain-containing protein n=1 Tax=Sesamum radiatum TaxID=300843 RepID=A0AAW2QF99_SESRA
MTMAPVGCSSPSSPLDSTSAVCSQVTKDHVLNMSPRPFHNLNPSSAELMNEIATLEVEIVRLERYLLSLYRTAFQQHLPSNSGNHVQQITGISPWNKSDQPSPRRNLETSKDYHDHQGQISPTSALTGPNDLIQVAIPKSSSGRVDMPHLLQYLAYVCSVKNLIYYLNVCGQLQENRSTYSRHRSLADHLGNCRIDDALLRPDKLSEDIIRCISSIYCKLANPGRTNKGYSVRPLHHSARRARFLPEIYLGVGVLNILSICLLIGAVSLVKSLEIVDLKKMRREEKLAFWINIHNALVMHAAYNVGGHCVNAYDIQSCILGIKSHYSPPISKQDMINNATWTRHLIVGVVCSGRDFVFLIPNYPIDSKPSFLHSFFAPLLTHHEWHKRSGSKHFYHPERSSKLGLLNMLMLLSTLNHSFILHFAQAYSDPAVRVYTAKNIFQDLKVAKEDFIQATVYVHKQTKIYLPLALLCMSLGMAALLEVVSGCLTSNRTQSESL